MDLNQMLRNHASQPLTHQLLMSLLKDYKRPNDKVHELLNHHILEPIKKGLYMAGPLLETATPEPFLVANHILGPSYISSDSALSYYGLIPERVYEISSVTTTASRKFTTLLGLFTYAHLPLPYYSFGIAQAVLSKDQFVMVASPEKALFDKMITTSGIVLRSQKSTADYLIDDLRIDEENLRNLDLKAMRSWLPNVPKKESLLMVIKFIDSL